MATFTGVGDSVELSVAEAGENVLTTIFGTYNMVIELQKKVGEGAWKTLKTFNTEDATESHYYTTQGYGEVLRLIVITDTSGTAIALLTDESDKVLREFSGFGITTPVQIKQSGLNLNGNGMMGAGVTSYAATDTLTQKANAGRVALMSVATGMTLTLPAATGTGDVYTIFVATTVTSNSYIINAASAADTFNGGVSISTDIAGVTMLTAAATDTITMNGSTTGGLIGSWVRLTDVASGLWMLEGFLKSTGSEATPFSAAVS